jgi:hypothetical protein
LRRAAGEGGCHGLEAMGAGNGPGGRGAGGAVLVVQCWWCSAGEAMRPAFAAAGSVACSKRKRRLHNKRGFCRAFSPEPLQGSRSRDCKELQQAAVLAAADGSCSLLALQQRNRAGAMALLHPCPRARRPAGIGSTAAGDRGVDEAMPLACP